MKWTHKVVTKNTRRRNENGTIHRIARKNPASAAKQNVTENLTRPTQREGKARKSPKGKKREENRENRQKGILKKSTNIRKILRIERNIDSPEIQRRTDITARHTNIREVTRHTDTPKMKRVKLTDSRKIPGKTDILARHADSREVTRHTGTPKRQMSVTVKFTDNREILGQTDIIARHTDTQEMIGHTDTPGI